MPLYSQTVRRKSLIQACVVAAIVFGGWAALKAHSAEIEIPPVEAMNVLDKATRAEQYNLATPEGIAQDRMTVLGLWHTAAPNDAKIKESLTSMRENFLHDFPGHPNAYFIAWEVLEARGTLSADALKTILDSTLDKTTARYASDLISHANRLSMEQRFDEALAEYEAALALPACPQDRLTELYTQMASTHLYSKRYDKARECVLEAKRHADQAQAIALSLDSKLDLIEEVASNRSLPLSPPSSTNGIQHWLFWLNTLALLVIGGYYTWRRFSNSRSVQS